MNTVADELKALLKQRGISICKAAEHMPIHYTTLQNTLSGRIPCTQRVEEVIREAITNYRSIGPQKRAVLQEIEALYAAGIPRIKIAAMIGVPHGAVVQMMNREKIADRLWLKAYENLIKKTPRDSSHGSVNAK